MMSSVIFMLSLILAVMVQAQDHVPAVVADQCFEPMSPGFCRAYFPAFFYNPLTETCECFVFGGCAPNGNNFATLEDCMSTCSVKPQLQTVSDTCIDIFGADDPALIMPPLRSISPRPIVFSSVEPVHMNELTVADEGIPAISVDKPTSTTSATPATSSSAAATSTPETTTILSDISTQSSTSPTTLITKTSSTAAPAPANDLGIVPTPSPSPPVPVVNASTILTNSNLQILQTILQRLMKNLRTQQTIE